MIFVNRTINKRKEGESAHEKKIDPEPSLTMTRVKINFEVDLIAVMLLMIGICTRFYRLEEPKSIV